MFTNGLNIGLPQRAWAQMAVHEVKTQWLSRKETVPDATVSKEDHTGTYKGPMTIDFHGKGATVNSSSFRRLLR